MKTQNLLLEQQVWNSAYYKIGTYYNMVFKNWLKPFDGILTNQYVKTLLFLI